MRVPYTWLQDYVDLEGTAEQAAELLAQVGVPVELIEREGAEITHVLTGWILSVETHPDADRLKVTRVDVGSGTPLQIVTAAPNVRVDQVVAVATHGALLAGGLKIKKGKLRGVVSEGMFCSAAELGIDSEDLPIEQREGILDLDPGIAPGREIQEVLRLAEEVLVLETFANRPDQLSLVGVARELAARLGRPLKLPEVLPQDGAPEPSGDLVEIQDLEGCPRYIARVIEEVQVGPSPSWMVRRLESAGMRAVNNVVDITNYVMLETGQPLHAFDLDRLAGGRVVVRRSQPGEHLTTLDGGEHELPAGTLVIADAEKPVAMAGVMGGLDSEIGPETRRILLESACFHSGAVRRASLRLGLRTESSRRFEKGMDPRRVALGSARAAHLLESLAGRVVPGVVDRGIPPQPPTEIVLRPARVRQVLGVEIPAERTRALLEALEFLCTPEEQGLKVRVPSHRQDVLEEADLIEEVARHYGYDNLPVTVPHGEPRGAMPAEDELEEWVREAMARLGWSELLTPSLHHPELLERYRLEVQPATVMNPLSEDQRVLRPALFPSLVEVVRRNLRVRNRDLCLFEVSRVFHPQGQDVLEPLRLGLALCRPGAGFLDLKGALEQLAILAGLEFDFEVAPQAWLHPGRAARIRVGEQALGWAGEIHPHLASELDLEAPVALAELDLDVLSGLRSHARYRPISRFPEVERDLALLVTEEVPAGTLARRMAQAGGDLVRAVACFDVYRGAQVPEGHKSLAFRALLQAPDRTLTEDEIQRVLRKMLKVAEREFSARLRD